MAPQPALASLSEIEQQSPWRELRLQMWADGDDQQRLDYARRWRAQPSLDARRALLIELQLEIASLPAGIDSPTWPALNREIHRILRQLAPSLTPRWFEAAGIEDPVFHRGFLEQVTIPCHTLLEPRQRRQLFDSTLIRHLNITGIETLQEFQLLLAIPEFDRLLSLGLDAQNIDDHCLLLFTNARISNLRWLSLAHNRITERGVRILAEAGHNLRLHYVDLTANPCDPADRLPQDLGVAVGRERSRWTPQLEQDYGVLPWLHRQVQAGRVVVPNRLTVATVGHALPT